MVKKHGLHYLELKEEKRLYPPRFVINVRRSRTAEDSHVDFTFQGATREIVKRIFLNITEGIIYMILRLICRYFHGV